MLKIEEAITSFRREYVFLSNMYSVPFEWDGRTYHCSEAAFQSAKTLDPKERDSFRNLTGVVAKRLGRKIFLRRDWEDVKDGIMEEVVRAKFTQNPDLAKKLVETGDAPLMEGNSWHDTYWGVDGKTLDGENRLGIILMKIRAELSRGDYLETAEKAKAEKEESKRLEAESLEKERREILSQLGRIPAYDFTGMEVGTKAFGRGKILRQDGNYLIVLVNGQEKKFALPGCFVQGFLRPDDMTITDNLKQKQDLEKRLAELDRKKG